MTTSGHSLMRSASVGFACSVVALASGCPIVPPGTLVVDEGDDGSAVTMRVGRKLILTLNSNPSTGFEWETTELDSSVLEETDRRYVHGCWIPMPGCGGTVTWQFTALSPGSTPLRLLYHQPWEGGMFGRTFELTVTVTGDD